MKIALIGAGRLAESLGCALHASGHSVACVFSRSAGKANALAEAVGGTATDSLDDVCTDADAYIVAVKDAAIAEVARRLCPGREHGLFVHTAGSVGMEVFDGLAPRHGVLYPLQTFSHGRTVDFSVIPCFVEGNSSETLAAIRIVAESVSRRVITLDGEGRRSLHLAAVFACNFANHCYAVAADVLARKGIPFDTLLPLIDETASKVHSMPPAETQTGPALRYDEGVMAAHLAMLGGDNLAKAIYETMSKSIHQKAIQHDKL